MNDILKFKQKEINDYIMTVNLNDVDPEKIQHDLTQVLSERPCIKLEYADKVVMLEGIKSVKKTDKLVSVSVIFTSDDIYGNPIPYTSKFLLF